MCILYELPLIFVTMMQTSSKAGLYYVKYKKLRPIFTATRILFWRMVTEGDTVKPHVKVSFRVHLYLFFWLNVTVIFLLYSVNTVSFSATAIYRGLETVTAIQKRATVQTVQNRTEQNGYHPNCAESKRAAWTGDHNRGTYSVGAKHIRRKLYRMVYALFFLYNLQDKCIV